MSSHDPSIKVAGKRAKFGRGLANARTAAQKKSLPRVGVLRDSDGSYTEVGKPDPITGQRRMWLAGISAQRGY